MVQVIYRKSDLLCVGTVIDGISVEQEIELNVIPNFGGQISDYEVFNSDKASAFHLERSTDGKIAAIDNPIPSLPPTKEEILAQTISQLTLENADLKQQMQTLSETVAKALIQ